MSELRGSESTEQPHEAERPSQADQVARIKELNALGDAKAFDPRTRPYDPLEHIRPGDRSRSDDEGSDGPAVSRPPGDAPATVERPRLLGLADRVRQLSAERFEQTETDEPNLPDKPRQADELSDAERLADQLDDGGESAGPAETEVDERLKDWDRAENPYSPLGGPDSRYDPDLPAEEQDRRRAEGLARAEAAFDAANWPGRDRAGSIYYDDLVDTNQERYPDGVAISYEGCPEFERYAIARVELEDGFGPSRGADFRQADSLAGFDKRPPGTTWHHAEDGRTMYLVDRDLHADVPHWGGVRVSKVMGTWDRKASDDSDG